jgi:hypothetical protein
MMKLFNLFLENSYKRMNSAGFSPSDVVKLRKDAIGHEYVKAGSDIFQKAIKQLIDDGAQLVLKNFELELQKPNSVNGFFAIVRPLVGPNWVGQSEFMLPTDLLELCYQSQDVAQMHKVEAPKVVKEARDPLTNLDTRTRIAISNAFGKAGLDGNGRFKTVGAGISKISEVLDKLGYSLDMVSNDLEVSQAHHRPEFAEGQRQLRFRKKNETEDAYHEHPEIENSVIAMSWYSKGKHGFEILAYPS